jgi:hypothetical protein
VIQHIDVHAALQQSVPGFYANLVTRPTGRAVREHIERRIAGATVAVMDFTSVGCLDYSCADEIVAKLVRERVRVLVLRGVGEGHREAIEPVLRGHGLAVMVERADGTLDALGQWTAPLDAHVDELVARRLAVRGPGGAVLLTLP